MISMEGFALSIVISIIAYCGWNYIHSDPMTTCEKTQSRETCLNELQ
jgi:hypothetical protein